MKQDSNPNEDLIEFSNRSWRQKFRVAFRGILTGIKGPRGWSGPNSFFVHLPCSIIVIAAGILLKLDSASIAILLLCIGLVFVAELINSSVERLAKAVTNQPNEHLKAALDIASGAVLAGSLVAVTVGAVVFGSRIQSMLNW